MRNKDLPSTQNLCQGDSAVILPFASSFDVIDEDDEVIGLALVDDLGDLFVSARHFDGYGCCVS